MQSSAQMRWIRPVRQLRSQETIERLLDAAEAAIADKGFDDISVAEIARRAGFSVGAFYARFRDKEALFHCLQERFVEEARATAAAVLAPETWKDAGVAEITRETAAFMVRVHRERSGLLREILSRAHCDPVTGQRAERLIAFICQRLQILLLDRAREIGHPEPEVAAGFAFRLVLGILKEAILFRGPGAYGIPGSDERLAAELGRAFLGYLGVRNERVMEPSPTTPPTGGESPK